MPPKKIGMVSRKPITQSRLDLLIRKEQRCKKALEKQRKDLDKKKTQIEKKQRSCEKRMMQAARAASRPIR